MYDQFFPYVLVQITDDNGIVRSNLAGSAFPFPLLVKSVEFKRSISEASSRAFVTLDSTLTSGTQSVPVGRYEGFFSDMNNQMTLVIGSGSPGVTQFTGNIYGWNKTLKNQIPRLELKAVDKTESLMHTYLNNVKVFASGTDYGQIVRDLLTDVETRVSFTTGTVPLTGSSINRDLTFYRRSVFDVIKEVAEKIQYDFWVDTNGNLNFKTRGSTASSIVLDSNINGIEATLDRDIDDTYNTVWIYGGRIQSQDITVTNEAQRFTSGTLVYGLGHMFIGSIIAASGTVASSSFVFQQPRDYALSSNNELVFTSNGSKPDNSTNVNVTYQYRERGRAVFYLAKDSAVVSQFEQERVKWLYKPELAANASGTTLTQRYQAALADASGLAASVLNDNKYPLERLRFRTQEWIPIQLGDQVTVNVPEFSVRNVSFRVTDINVFYDNTSPIEMDLTLKKIQGAEVQ